MAKLVIRPFVPDDYHVIAGHAADIKGPAFTGLVDGEIAACAGVVLDAHARGGTAWAYVGRLGRQHGYFVSRSVIRGLLDIIRRHKLIRVEADARADFALARRWLGWMGVEDEGGVRKRGPKGEDMIRYALFPKWHSEVELF